MIPINEKLRAVFTALNTTPHRFANDHRLGRTTIFNIVGGKAKPGLDILQQLCKADTRISAEYLLRGEGEPLREVQYIPINKADTKTLSV